MQVALASMSINSYRFHERFIGDKRAYKTKTFNLVANLSSQFTSINQSINHLARIDISQLIWTHKQYRQNPQKIFSKIKIPNKIRIRNINLTEILT